MRENFDISYSTDQVIDLFYAAETCKVINIDLMSFNQNNITIKIDADKEQEWDYFFYRLKMAVCEFKVHKLEDHVCQILLSNIQETFKYQMNVLGMLLECKIYLIKRPKVENINVIFKSTNRCNFDCAFCYDKPFRDALHQFKHTSFEDTDHLFSMLRDYTQHINLIWHGGEPLMSGKEFYKTVYEEILPKYPQLTINHCMQTNGSLIDDEWLMLFNKYGIKPGTSYQYNSWDLRGKRLDGSQIQGADEDLILKKRKQAEMFGVEMGIIDVVTRQDVPHLIEKYNFYKERQIPMVLNEVFAAGSASINKDEVAIESKEEIDAYLAGIRPYFEYWMADNHGGVHDRFASLECQLLLERSSTVCHHVACLGHNISINSNGDLYHCDRPYLLDYRIGHVSEFHSMDEIYNSKVYTKLREETQQKYVSFCKNCKIYEYCYGYCPLRDLDLYQTASIPDLNKCYERREMLEMTYEIMRSITDINECNTYLQYMVRKNNRFLPYEILNIAKELGLQSVIDAFAEEKDNYIGSKEFEIFKALNPSLHSSSRGMQLLPTYHDEIPTGDYLTDDERYEALKNKLMELFLEIKAEQDNDKQEETK